MNYKIFLIIFSAMILAACSGAGGSGPTLTPVEQEGQAVYTLRCAQCHALTPDTVVIGPSLAGIATRAASRVPGYDTQTYLEASILFLMIILWRDLQIQCQPTMARNLLVRNLLHLSLI